MWRFSLLVTTVTGDFSSAMNWLKQNGPELLDATEHCEEALRLGRDLASKNGDLFDAEHLGSFLAWGALEAMGHVDQRMLQALVRQPAAKLVKEKAKSFMEKHTHADMKHFCGNMGAVRGEVMRFNQEYGHCYGQTACLAMESVADIQKCNAVFSSFIPKLIKIEQEGTCEMEGGHYCQEEMTKLLLDDPNCFMQFMQPAEHVTCSEECVLQWKKAEEKMPKCMKSLEQNRKKSFRVTVDFVKGIMRAGKDWKVQRQAGLIPEFKTFKQGCLSGSMVMV